MHRLQYTKTCGGVLSLGKGAIYSASFRQKLNTKSLTESELVGVDNVMPRVLWTQQFMEQCDQKQCPLHG